MSRGQPDYGMYAVKEVAASISDMGEVAARLGSIVTYDKRGDVVDFDNFEGPVLKWDIEKTPASASAKLSSESVKSGSQAIHLATAASATSYVRIVKPIPLLGTLRLGIEHSFSYLLAKGYTQVYLDRYDGENFARALVWLDLVTRKLYLVDDADQDIEIATLPLLANDYFFFHTLKMVVDFDTLKYVRVMMNEKEYDVSAYAFASTPSVAAPQISSSFLLRNNTADANDAWFDDVISTQAEP